MERGEFLLDSLRFRFFLNAVSGSGYRGRLAKEISKGCSHGYVRTARTQSRFHGCSCLLSQERCRILTPENLPDSLLQFWPRRCDRASFFTFRLFAHQGTPRKIKKEHS